MWLYDMDDTCLSILWGWSTRGDHVTHTCEDYDIHSKNVNIIISKMSFCEPGFTGPEVGYEY